MLRVLAGRQPLVARAVRAQAPMGARALSTKAQEGSFSLVSADQTMAAQRIFHKTSLACLAITPVAFLLHPTPLAMPVDVALSVLFPLHAHIGLNWIITDYAPGAGPGSAPRMALVAATGIAVLGLLKLSLTGDGLVGTLKATWRGPEEKKEAK